MRANFTGRRGNRTVRSLAFHQTVGPLFYLYGGLQQAHSSQPGAQVYFGCIRMAPSTRIVSPLTMVVL